MIFHRDMSWLDDFELPTRVLNCIAHSPYNTVEELAQAPNADLLKLKGFGRTTLRDLREVIPHASQRPDLRKEVATRLRRMRGYLAGVVHELDAVIERLERYA